MTARIDSYSSVRHTTKTAVPSVSRSPCARPCLRACRRRPEPSGDPVRSGGVAQRPWQTRRMTWELRSRRARGRVAVVAGATRARAAGSPPRSARRARPCTAPGAAAGITPLRVRLRPARDHRGDRRAGDRARRRRASRSRSTTSTPLRWRRSPSGSATEHGHIDVLVNDIWGGEMLKGGPARVEHADLGARPRRPACASCASRSTPTSSRRTTCCRCWSTGRAGWSSR